MNDIDKGRRLTLKIVSATLIGVGAVFFVSAKPSFDVPPGQRKKTPTPSPTSTPPSGSSSIVWVVTGGHHG